MSFASFCALLMSVSALISIAPWWNYSREWGYAPMGIVTGLFVVVCLVLAFSPAPTASGEQAD